MERYPIPQFIEQEGKIAFFISFRQFFYLVGAGVVCFLLYYVLPFFPFVVISIAIFGGAVALAFITINGVPVLNMILGSIGFAVGGKNYTWKKKESLSSLMEEIFIIAQKTPKFISVSCQFGCRSPQAQR